jgi:cell division septation protein DedD
MTDPAQVIHAIRIGTGTDSRPEGYCTDPAYEGKILSLIKQYNLQQYDVDVPTPGPAPQPEPTPQPAPDPSPDPSGKQYRVRVGIYKQEKYLNAMKRRINDVLNLDCFTESHDDGIHIYCGSFSNKENAEARAKLLNDAGFKTEIEEV